MKVIRQRTGYRGWIILPFLFFLLTCPITAKDAGPPIGSAAPAIGPCKWFQKDNPQPCEVGKLRGRVVLIHTFAVGCAP